jgi:lipopolysaccharide/colanic/teichoic acid biosynthesis glycosyltransferase
MGEAMAEGTAEPRPHRDDAGKRALDMALAIVTLALTLPFMMAIALLVRASSRGGAFFVQERVGRKGRPFRMYKFRTMVVEASALQASLEVFNELDGAIFAIRHDPRVTALGRWLRRYSLDELPQLINVVKGEMSLVGPRPLPRRDYLLLSPECYVRFEVRPGMTGLAQVHGRNSLPFNQMMLLDRCYVQQRSLAMDLKILMLTPLAVIGAAGAY